MIRLEAATPAHRGDDAGRQGNATLGSSQLSDTAKSTPIQANNVVAATGRFRRAPPSLLVRISPGRSQPFVLGEEEFAQLIAIAARMELSYIAERMGGEVFGNSVLAPGPGRPPDDRSLLVTPPVGSWEATEAVAARDKVALGKFRVCPRNGGAP